MVTKEQMADILFSEFEVEKDLKITIDEKSILSNTIKNNFLFSFNVEIRLRNHRATLPVKRKQEIINRSKRLLDRFKTAYRFRYKFLNKAFDIEIKISQSKLSRTEVLTIFKSHGVIRDSYKQGNVGESMFIVEFKCRKRISKEHKIQLQRELNQIKAKTQIEYNFQVHSLSLKTRKAKVTIKFLV